MEEAKEFSDVAMIVIGRPGERALTFPQIYERHHQRHYNPGLTVSNAPANWRYMNATYKGNGNYEDFEPGETYLELSVTENSW